MSEALSGKTIRVTTFRTWELVEVIGPKQRKTTLVPPGQYELIRLANPLGFPNAPWLVLKDARAEDRIVGMTEGAWRQWTNGELCDNPGHPNHGKPIDWEEFEIRFE